MKKIVQKFVLICVWILFATNLVYPQSNPVPNYSFENWIGNVPMGWNIHLGQDPGNISQSNDAYDGMYSIQFNKAAPDLCECPDTKDQFSDCGGRIYSDVFPFERRYSSARLYVKPKPGFTTECLWIQFDIFINQISGWSTSASFVYNVAPGSSGWTEININIDYPGPGNPDSANIHLTFSDTAKFSSDYILVDKIELIDRSLYITQPTGGEKWIAGGKNTIKWEGGEDGDLVQLEFSADSGNTYQLIDNSIVADTGMYAWEIPDSILSTKSFIRIFSMGDPTVADTSEVFKIKGYKLTKLNGNGNYIAYDILSDRWGFGNLSTQVWPPNWWSRFNYQGIDPFTGLQYSQWQGNFVFATTLSQEFPDWEAFVNAFSVDACYISTNLGVYSPSALNKWEAINNFWGGSCFGIAGANALAFSHNTEFTSEFPFFPTFTDPITVTSDTNVIPVISQLFTHQFGNPSSQFRTGRWNTITPNETLNELKDMLIEDDVPIRTISIWNNNGSGGHNILPYELEQDDTQEELYYLYVYDNSYPNTTTALILIDTTGNSNQGIWLTTYGWTSWGGPKKLMLEIESDNYLNNAILPKRNEAFVSPFIMSGDELEVYTNINANTKILDSQGNITGFMDGTVLNEIPNSIPLIYLNGSETPPYGYSLTTDNYSIQLSDVESDTIETFFFTGNKTFTYERVNVNSNETDRLFFDGGVSAVNPDPIDKLISLVNIINESSQEKLFALRSVGLSQDDSVKIENINNDQLKLISYGTSKSYEIELNYVAETGLGRFGHSSVQLDMNTSHIYLPVWNDLTNSQLIVLVDNGNDGTIDDTLYLSNTVDVEDQGSLYIPNEYNLEQNYPNPFNPTTTIKYSIPTNEFVTLKVYNSIGEQIVTLVNKEQTIGNYEVQFNATSLPSGVYFYRLQAGDFVETKKMILMK